MGGPITNKVVEKILKIAKQRELMMMIICFGKGEGHCVALPERKNKK